MTDLCPTCRQPIPQPATYTNTRTAPDGYTTSTQARRRANITYRQLDHWTTRYGLFGIDVINPEAGPGTPRYIAVNGIPRLHSIGVASRLGVSLETAQMLRHDALRCVIGAIRKDARNAADAVQRRATVAA